MSTNREFSNQTARMRMLIWTYAVCKLYKGLFRVLRAIFKMAIKRLMTYKEVFTLQQSLGLLICHWKAMKIKELSVTYSVMSVLISANRFSSVILHHFTRGKPLVWCNWIVFFFFKQKLCVLFSTFNQIIRCKLIHVNFAHENSSRAYFR